MRFSLKVGTDRRAFARQTVYPMQTSPDFYGSDWRVKGKLIVVQALVCGTQVVGYSIGLAGDEFE